MKELKRFIKKVKKAIKKATPLPYEKRGKYLINHKLTDSQKKSIRIEYKKGGGNSKFKTEEKVSIHSLMKKYRASYGTIWNIVNKK